LSLNLNEEIDNYHQEFLDEFDILWNLVKSTNIYATEQNKGYFLEHGYGDLSKNISMDELIRRGQVDPVKTLSKELSIRGVEFSKEVVYTCAISIKYEGYINRSTIENERIYRLGKKKINWESLIKGNISTECRERIEEVKPSTFSQLQRIDGIRPATLAYVAGNIIQ
jgi:tRNA uridine 5-carboxymethylaminomethyl modification enzyme